MMASVSDDSVIIWNYLFWQVPLSDARMSIIQLMPWPASALRKKALFLFLLRVATQPDLHSDLSRDRRGRRRACLCYRRSRGNPHMWSSNWSKVGDTGNHETNMGLGTHTHLAPHSLLLRLLVPKLDFNCHITRMHSWTYTILMHSLLIL